MKDDKEHWQEVRELLAQVLEHPPSEWRAMVGHLAQGKPELLEELLSLVQAAQSDQPLEGVCGEWAAEALQSHIGDTSYMGQRLGPWRIVSPIARGGMGEVYRAERADGQFEQQVAIKVLRWGFDADWRSRRLVDEKQMLAGLDHPNLVRVFDGGTTEEGLPYFVMELVEGEPIDSYCERLELSVPARLALFRTVCQVVGYAHDRGIVHRDLKADNILVTTQGIVKLLDFGIAKRQIDTRVTATAQQAMTIAYASPEQVRGATASPPSDVYSLGVLLYRLLTESDPYGQSAGSSAYELLKAICDTEPLLPSRALMRSRTTRGRTDTMAKRWRVHGDVDAIVMKALRKDPTQRYENAGAMGDDVFRHIEGLPVHARRAAWSYRLHRFVLRHRSVMGATILANFALIIGVGLAIHQGTEANRQRMRAEAHLATARDFANALIFDVHDIVKRLPGSVEARKILVQKALAFLQALSADSASNPDLQLVLATSYRKVADLQGGINTPNIGDFDGALESHERAIGLLHALIARAPAAKTESLSLELATSLGGRAAILGFNGRFEEAQKIQEEVVAIASTLVQKSPKNREALLLQATALGSVSWLLYQRGDIAGFLARASHGEQLLKSVLAIEPDDEDSNLALSAAYMRLGWYYLNADRTRDNALKAVDYLSRRIDIQHQLLKRNPDNPRYRAQSGESYMHISDAYSRLNDLESASKTLRLSLDEAMWGVAQDKHNDSARSRLLEARMHFAESALTQRKFADAYEQALFAIQDYQALSTPSQAFMFHAFASSQAQYIAGSALMAQASTAQRNSANARRLHKEACERFGISEAQFRALTAIPPNTEATFSLKMVLDARAGCAH